ncbi:hypothetical protein B0H12DRAFT_80588 [Mycena haematopus]|nr:hypothetical protein B0H12DRAFT_426297 [Mycena haematopus]KAJ7239385.1 hypothetical protein B0H12DRAFT_80588 [Mycena haematopus]
MLKCLRSALFSPFGKREYENAIKIKAVDILLIPFPGNDRSGAGCAATETTKVTEAMEAMDTVDTCAAGDTNLCTRTIQLFLRAYWSNLLAHKTTTAETPSAAATATMGTPSTPTPARIARPSPTPRAGPEQATPSQVRACVPRRAAACSARHTHGTRPHAHASGRGPHGSSASPAATRRSDPEGGRDARPELRQHVCAEGIHER